jgi:hypothetical protein
MPLKSAILKIKNWMKNFIKGKKTRQDDTVVVNLPGLSIKLNRKLDIDTPHEVTVVVPRAEIRKRCLDDACTRYEYEIIYSSITVVHAPRHPLAGPPPSPPPEIPPRKS